jgi:hypothetical protein
MVRSRRSLPHGLSGDHAENEDDRSGEQGENE